MQWLLALEIDNDPISLCRLMNNFRRKGIRVVALSLAAAGAGFSLTAVVETPEAGVDHLFHFLRRSEGVDHVSCYLPASDQEPDSLRSDGQVSYIFVNAGSDSSGNSRVVELFPGGKVIVGSQGKLLLEIPVKGGGHYLPTAVTTLDGVEFVRFIRVKTSRAQAVSQLVA